MVVTTAQTSVWEHHIHVILRAEEFFKRDMVLSIGLFKELLGNFLTNYNIFL